MNKNTEDTTDPGFDSEDSKSEIFELNEDDLEQVSGGADAKVGQNQTTYGVQKDKMKTAQKNADTIKGLL